MPGNRNRSRIAAPLILAALFCGHAQASADPIDEDGGLSAYAGSNRSSHSIGTNGPQITTSFRHFTGETLHVGFALEQGAGRASWREFGIDRRELDTLQQNCIDSGRCNQSEMNRLTFDYYYRHGLRTRQVAGRGVRLYVDVPQVARRNQARVQPLAAALQRLAAEKGGDQRWLVDAAVALVQTGLKYRQPAALDEGRQIAGFYPPARALEKGYGDCDTKAALLAAILLNLEAPRMIGVHVPQHYLLGIAGTPQPGQAFLRHEGEAYVLVETAGPALRSLGEIADTTQAALQRREGLRIDPII
jgi:hypothetical protein